MGKLSHMSTSVHSVTDQSGPGTVIIVDFASAYFSNPNALVKRTGHRDLTMNDRQKAIMTWPDAINMGRMHIFTRVTPLSMTYDHTPFPNLFTIWMPHRRAEKIDPDILGVPSSGLSKTSQTADELPNQCGCFVPQRGGSATRRLSDCYQLRSHPRLSFYRLWLP